MATELGRVYLDGCNYELAYDLLSQSVENNTSDVRLYGILHVTNNYIAWSSGSASVHTSGLQPIGTYYSRGDYVVITRDFTFTHDSNGNFSLYIGASLSTTFVSGNCGGTMTLPRIDRFATMTDATANPTDESTFWFKYNNPRNLTLTAWLEVNPVGPWYAQRTITNAGTSGTYTWELTEEERNQLRARMPNSKKGKITIGLLSTIGGTDKTSVITRDFTIVNANPIFLDYDIEDVNPITVALTGSTENDVVNVNGYSNIQATISTSNKAEAIKQASMVKYRLAIGDNSTDITYSDENDVNGTLNGASNGTYNLYAIDSRNNSTLLTKQATSIINYEKVAIDKQNCSFVRDNNQVGTNAILTLNGTFWNDNFGQANNSLSVSYRLKKSDSSTWAYFITTDTNYLSNKNYYSYSGGQYILLIEGVDYNVGDTISGTIYQEYGTTTITPTINNNDFTFTGMIASDNLDTTWDLDSSYNLEVIVSDELSSATIELILNSAVPTMSLDKNGVGIMCAYNSSLGGLLQVGGKIIDGGTILWTNPNPTSNFSAQNITLSSNDYDMLLWIIKRKANSTTFANPLITIKGYGGLPTSVEADGTTRRRSIDYTNDTTYSCRDATAGATTPDNTFLIPIYIIGYKTGLFS